MANITDERALGESGARIIVEEVKKVKKTAESKYSKPEGGIPLTDLADTIRASLAKADSALQSFTETDPTVPDWAKAPTKPKYAYSEIEGTPKLADVATSGSYNDLTDKIVFMSEEEVRALFND